MGLFDRIKKPVFYKEDSTAKEQLETLESLFAQAPPALRGQLEQDIRCLKAGIAGEGYIAYELRHCHIPMIVLHDLYLESDDLSAQIDYLLITRRQVFVLECKNLYGNIEINYSGDFVRTIRTGGTFLKEGIYSPITQNRRHLSVLKDLLLSNRGLFVSRGRMEEEFRAAYQSLVVLANPKTVLEASHASREVREQVVRVDQLTQVLEDRMESYPLPLRSEKEMMRLARFFLSMHQEDAPDYVSKYEAWMEEAASLFPDPQEAEYREVNPSPRRIVCPQCGAPMVRRTAKKGPRAGKDFWGCSNYPACRCTINIDDRSF